MDALCCRLRNIKLKVENRKMLLEGVTNQEFEEEMERAIFRIFTEYIIQRNEESIEKRSQLLLKVNLIELLKIDF